MIYTGRVIDGRYYLGTRWGYKEVSEEIYYEYMRLQWREWKAREREFRCYDGGKRCSGQCAECDLMSEGRPVSIEQLYEDNEFDIEDTKRRSVEETVIQKMMIEALYEEIGKLQSEDRFLIEALYLYDEPMTQKEVGKVLGIDQSTVTRRKDRVLATLREAMKGWKD